MAYLKKGKRAHFDAVALLHAVQAQPVGLAVVTNHPAGFRRMLYLAMRKQPLLRCTCLQSPDSATCFWLVSSGYEAKLPDSTNSLKEAS